MDWSAKVIPLEFQVAVGQKFGWLNEEAKQRRKLSKNESVGFNLWKEDHFVKMIFQHENSEKMLEDIYQNDLWRWSEIWMLTIIIE